jgi:hypothetical protein
MNSAGNRYEPRGSGGSAGGVGQFLTGLAMTLVGLWLFFDSVRLTTNQMGFLTRLFGGGHGALETTSMGILFIPFFIGVVALFYDARMKWAWGLTLLGIAILAIEIVSRMRFYMDGKVTHFLMMMVLFAGGTGLMIRSYLPAKRALDESSAESDRESGEGEN